MLEERAGADFSGVLVIFMRITTFFAKNIFILEIVEVLHTFELFWAIG